MSPHGLISPSFFFLTIEKYTTVGMDHSLYIHLLIAGHLSCLQVLAVMNKAVINIHT